LSVKFVLSEAVFDGGDDDKFVIIDFIEITGDAVENLGILRKKGGIIGVNFKKLRFNEHKIILSDGNNF